jgi:hypothetical protein
MAKVKIQGNASGTGVLTVTAPNTSTDRTITLPDSTDTLAVNSDVTNKLPLAGGTLTGDLAVGGGISGTGAMNISGSGWGVLPYVANSLVVDSVSGATRLFATGTDATTDGNFLFYTGQTDGGANERLRIQSGGGISFNGDTAAANALDDYEEGTWTPTGTALAGGAAGTYTKIGNVVTVEGYFKSNATSTTRTSFGGLPFAAGNFNVTNVTGVGNSSYNTQQNSLIVRVDEQAATFSFCQSSSSISLGDANSENSFTITYKVS